MSNETQNAINKLRVEVNIDRNDLDNEIADHSAKFLYVAEQCSTAELAVEAHKNVLEQTEARIAQKERNRLSKGLSKVTEKTVDHAVRTNSEYTKAQQNLANARKTLNDMKALRDAYYARKDLLLALAYNERAEKKSLLTSV